MPAAASIPSVVSEDEGENYDGSDEATGDNSEERPPTDSQLDTDSRLHAGAEVIFSLDGPDGPHVIVDEEDRLSHGSLASEFLHYHHRFGHAPPSKLRKMAERGIITSDSPIAMCPSAPAASTEKPLADHGEAGLETTNLNPSR